MTTEKVVLEYPTVTKIKNFLELETGWHYGEGLSFSQSTIDDAIRFHHEVTRQAFFSTDAFPGLNGEVLLTVYYYDYYLEFTFELNGNIIFYQEKDDEEVHYQEDLTFEEAITKLRGFREETWNTSESLTGDGTTGINIDFKVLSSAIQETHQESLSSAEIAYIGLEELSANILNYFTQTQQAISPSIGVSHEQYYLITSS
jgi:hypothetical protein